MAVSSLHAGIILSAPVMRRSWRQCETAQMPVPALIRELLVLVEPALSAGMAPNPKAISPRWLDRVSSGGQHGADVQAGTQKDSGEFLGPAFLEGESDSQRGGFFQAGKYIEVLHANETGDGQKTNEVEPGAALQRSPASDAGVPNFKHSSGGDLSLVFRWVFPFFLHDAGNKMCSCGRTIEH